MNVWGLMWESVTSAGQKGTAKKRDFKAFGGDLHRIRLWSLSAGEGMVKGGFKGLRSTLTGLELWSLRHVSQTHQMRIREKGLNSPCIDL